jgi:hypothetical protein
MTGKPMAESEKARVRRERMISKRISVRKMRRLLGRVAMGSVRVAVDMVFS